MFRSLTSSVWRRVSTYLRRIRYSERWTESEALDTEVWTETLTISRCTLIAPKFVSIQTTFKVDTLQLCSVDIERHRRSRLSLDDPDLNSIWSRDRSDLDLVLTRRDDQSRRGQVHHGVSLTSICDGSFITTIWAHNLRCIRWPLNGLLQRATRLRCQIDVMVRWTRGGVPIKRVGSKLVIKSRRTQMSFRCSRIRSDVSDTWCRHKIDINWCWRLCQIGLSSRSDEIQVIMNLESGIHRLRLYFLSAW